MEKSSEIQDVLGSLWTSSPLSRFEQPIVDGVDEELRGIHLLVRDVGVVQCPETRSLARMLLERTSCRQVRFVVQLRFDVPHGSRESRAGLEKELMRRLGRHWHGGDYGILEEEDNAEPVIYLYGLELAKESVLTEVSSILVKRNISRALLIVVLDQLAIEKRF